MTAEVSITAAGNGDFELKHPASPDPLILTAADVISLARQLPALARELLQDRSAAGSPRLQQIAVIHLGKVAVRHDAIGENVLLELTDTKGSDLAIELRVAQARGLVVSLLRACDEAATVTRDTRQ